MFWEFLSCLGDRIDLSSWDGYKGDMGKGKLLIDWLSILSTMNGILNPLPIRSNMFFFLFLLYVSVGISYFSNWKGFQGNILSLSLSFNSLLSTSLCFVLLLLLLFVVMFHVSVIQSAEQHRRLIGIQSSPIYISIHLCIHLLTFLLFSPLFLIRSYSYSYIPSSFFLGNDVAVIFFQEETSFHPTVADTLGTVPHIFAIVRPEASTKKTLYR